MIKELTARELIKVEDAVFNLSEALNVPVDLIIRILADGGDMNIVPYKRYEYMINHLKKNYYVKPEKKGLSTGKPELSFNPLFASEPYITFDIIKIMNDIRFDRNKEYTVAIKEINP